MKSPTLEGRLFIVGKIYENNRINVTVRWACRSEFGKKRTPIEMVKAQ